MHQCRLGYLQAPAYSGGEVRRTDGDLRRKPQPSLSPVWSRPVAQMKRKAFDAGLPWELSPGYVFRMRIEICDRLTGYEPVTVDVQLRCGDIVDNAKYLVSLRLYEQFGIFP